MKNLCIYSRRTDADGDHFQEAEHILSAGLGGRECLSKGMVSDEVNLLFSQWERSFMRNSNIAILRQFYGPGKRGSLSSKKATKSQVFVYNPSDHEDNANTEEVGLGYISLGLPYSIPTLQIRQGTYQIHTPENEKLESFVECLKNCPEDGFSIVSSEHMPAETALLGFHAGEWHLAQGAGFELQTLVQFLQNLKTGEINKISQQESVFRMHSHQHFTYNEVDYYKVIAKYAFNFLAHCIGQDAILEPTFDALREWIMSENLDDNPYVITLNSVSEILEKLPEMVHVISISKRTDQKLVAIVSLYGGAITHLVQLSADYGQVFDTKILICDWENRIENFL